MNNNQKLQDAFRRALQVPASVDVRTIRYGDAIGGRDWDSLQNMVLCTLIEDEFDVMIDIGQIARIRSFDAAMKVLKELGVDFGD